MFKCARRQFIIVEELCLLEDDVIKEIISKYDKNY